ncbi:MAG TPA: hypothetical protein VGH57_34345 [Amycolatopsis sp.]|jgi:hypothetical protein
MLSTSRVLAAKGLLEYGEEEAAKWVFFCSDDEFIRVCGVADWILLYGPKTPSGASMMIARGIAVAAVFVREGAPRELARSRRKKLSDFPPGWSEEMEKREDPSLPELREKGKFYGVTGELKNFWGTGSFGGT